MNDTKEKNADGEDFILLNLFIIIKTFAINNRKIQRNIIVQKF